MRDATTAAGELNVSSLRTEEHFRTRSLVPSSVPSRVSMRQLFRANVGEDFRIPMPMRWETGNVRDAVFVEKADRA